MENRVKYRALWFSLRPEIRKRKTKWTIMKVRKRT